MYHQNLDKFQFKFSAILCIETLSPTEVVIGVRESLMLLVNNHILKMVTIIEGLRVGHDVVAKYTAFQTIQRRRFQYANEE